MLIFTVIILILIIFAVVYVFLVMPRVTDGADMDMQSADYARRGVHSGGIAKNSIPALVAARDLGYGIELELSISSNGEIFINNCQVPTLKEVLTLIDGQVPLLLEIKSDKKWHAVCKRICTLLDSYSGAFAVESSDPAVLSFFKKYRPRYARGQILTAPSPKSKKKAIFSKKAFKNFTVLHLLTNIITRPDFIAIDGALMRKPAFLLATKLFGRVGFVRNVRNKRQYELCRSQGLYAIFENITP